MRKSSLIIPGLGLLAFAAVSFSAGASIVSASWPPRDLGDVVILALLTGITTGFVGYVVRVARAEFRRPATARPAAPEQEAAPDYPTPTEGGGVINVPMTDPADDPDADGR